MTDRCPIHNQFISIDGCTRCHKLKFISKSLTDVVAWLRNPKDAAGPEYVSKCLQLVIQELDKEHDLHE